LQKLIKGGKGTVKTEEMNVLIVGEHLHQAYPTDLPQVEIVTKENLSRQIKESEDYRTYIRGAVGKLG